jgi:hypothetical protein
MSRNGQAVGPDKTAPRGRAMWGFLGAWFFLNLAPTSSVVPIADAAFEHRMYLPLAAIIVGVVMMAWRLGVFLIGRSASVGKASQPQAGGDKGGKPLAGGDRWPPRLPPAATTPRLTAPRLVTIGLTIFAATAAALGWRTMQRNEDYHDVVGIWRKTTAQRPQNPRAHCNLGFALRETARGDEAIREYQEALRWRPDDLEAHYNLANALLSGRPAEAIGHYEATIRLTASTAKLADAYNNLGVALVKTGQRDRAVACFRQALQIAPDYADARRNLEIVSPTTAPSGR